MVVVEYLKQRAKNRLETEIIHIYSHQEEKIKADPTWAAKIAIQRLACTKMGLNYDCIRTGNEEVDAQTQLQMNRTPLDRNLSPNKTTPLFEWSRSPTQELAILYGQNGNIITNPRKTFTDAKALERAQNRNYLTLKKWNLSPEDYDLQP